MNPACLCWGADDSTGISAGPPVNAGTRNAVPKPMVELRWTIRFEVIDDVR